ncbi:hypothetical protein DM01DRAFT_1406350 [Hesseltinella vesiculosa]|uniref:Uncharacterized protein n=1 Tax=Hesseltinella vesiculosa TaxID=101127 RepID=A0A1X2GM28_9FUNG|nr:hypothetical protein DM01DRAFT_1406350 [Hesseltinella vesiculosa]
MLPQLSYVVAQAGVDASTGPSLPPTRYPPPYDKATFTFASPTYYPSQTTPLPMSSSTRRSPSPSYVHHFQYASPPPSSSYLYPSPNPNYYNPSPMANAAPAPLTTSAPPSYYSPLQQKLPRGFVVPEPREDPHAYTSSFYQDASLQRLDQAQDWTHSLTQLDQAFWTERENLYQDKLVLLQQELASIQNDTHETLRNLVADLDSCKTKTIQDAECFLNCQLAWMDHVYQEEIRLIEEEFNNEQRHLHDTLMAVIEDRKKQIKEERDDGLGIKDLFKEAYARVANKRSLRRRAAETSRNETRKRHRNQTDGHALLKEEEDLEEEYQTMKLVLDDDCRAPFAIYA